jgi:NAD(P)-dependent dehydrogenase (short-subunit alcohol dehydrogenase family)
MNTIAIFGAGPGLGLALARRFGREGYRVALVGRTPATLDRLTATLDEEGVDTARFVADLRDLDQVDAALADIRARFGSIDVVEYAPITTEGFVPAADLDVAGLQHHVDLLLRTPVHLVQRVLPDMVAAGDGAILVTHGGTAVNPAPGLSGLGPAMAATRNYLHSLHGEVAGKGVYVGTLVVNAMIIGSAAHQQLDSDAGAGFELPEGVELPSVTPEELAETYWQMLRDRDRVEAARPEGFSFADALATA